MTVRSVIAEQRSDPTALALNPALDIGALAQAYGLNCRLQIRDFLIPDSARGIVRGAPSPAPYSLTYNDGERTIELSARAVDQLGRREADSIAAAIREGARSAWAGGGRLENRLSVFGRGQNDPPTNN